MLFPLRTDRKLNHVPWVNIALIVVNIGIYAWQLWTQQAGHEFWTTRYLLTPSDPGVFQIHLFGYYLFDLPLAFFTYAFRHASEFHLALNMFFLWAFGNSLEDRLGHIGYLAFYLAGAGIAGIGHCLVEGLNSQPIIGASGA
ncbi:MAG: rhomboid family intramembrane serine protease, partial [Planctomycetota bacterium]